MISALGPVVPKTASVDAGSNVESYMNKIAVVAAGEIQIWWLNQLSSVLL